MIIKMRNSSLYTVKFKSFILNSQYKIRNPNFQTSSLHSTFHDTEKFLLANSSSSSSGLHIHHITITNVNRCALFFLKTRMRKAFKIFCTFLLESLNRIFGVPIVHCPVMSSWIWSAYHLLLIFFSHHI